MKNSLKDILNENFDTIGWVISSDGNKTRCKRSHYFQHKNEYSSPWFVREQDATDWQNKYIFKKNPKSSMTLYEIAEQAKDDIKQKNERLVKSILSTAQSTKKITKGNLELIKQMVQLNGNDPNKVDQLLKANGVQIIGEAIDLNKFSDKISGNVNKCPKCGSTNLTTTHDKPPIGYTRDNFKDLNWFHKCLNCGEIIPIEKNIEKSIEEMSTTSGIAGYNMPMFGEPEKVSVNSKGIRKRKIFKRKLK